MSSASPLPTAAIPPSALSESRRATAGGPDFERLDGGRDASLSFSDFLSIINPLQHIPIVGTLYRAITGDTIKPAPKVIGGFLFGGPLGLVSSVFNAMIEQTTGKDLGDQALALFRPGSQEPSPDAAPQFAAAQPDIAPLSRRLLGAEAPSTPAAALAAAPGIQPVTGRHARPLVKDGVDGAPAGHGRSLSDYWNSAGRALPVIDNSRSAATGAAAPVRLQTTAPLGERARASITPAPLLGETAAAKATSDDTAGEPARDDAFVTAMMRGLDRYREMKQAQNRPAPAVIDASL